MTFRDTTSVYERLVENSTPEPGPLATDCWVWQKGCCNKGYGHFYVYDPDARGTGKRARKGKSVEVRAHIASWALANGPVPADMTLDHECRNTKCIRPSHLELVTRVENVLRQHAARRELRRAELVEKSFPAPQYQAAESDPYAQHF